MMISKVGDQVTIDLDPAESKLWDRIHATDTLASTRVLSKLLKERRDHFDQKDFGAVPGKLAKLPKADRDRIIAEIDSLQP